jgi:hypothetical protein
MARVEKEHELFFLKVITGHRFLPIMSGVFGWGATDQTRTDRYRKPRRGTNLFKAPNQF